MKLIFFKSVNTFLKSEPFNSLAVSVEECGCISVLMCLVIKKAKCQYSNDVFSMYPRRPIYAYFAQTLEQIACTRVCGVCVGETEREESEYSILRLILKIDGDFELIINAHLFYFKADHRNLFLPTVSILSP